MRQVSDHFVSRAPRTLYHYTGLTALREIVRSNSLWVSSVHYMNDAMELQQAVDVIDYLLEPQVVFGGTSARTIFSTQFRDWIRELRGDVNRTLFIFSLTEAESLLSQWRSYTPHGKGVCIGFPVDIVNRLLDFNNFRLGKCVYTRNEQLSLLHDLIEKLWETCQQTSMNIFPRDTSERVNYASVFENNASDIFQVLALVKHHAFEEECEWRLISPLHFDLANCQFREGQSMVVPYVDISLGDTPVSFASVLLGPSAHSKLSLASLMAYLGREGTCTNVSYCEIPYREW